MRRALFITPLLIACGGLSPEPDGLGDGRARTIEEAPGVYRTTIDASDRERWVYFQFQNREGVEVANPTDSTEWDLSFRRFTGKLNSSLHGPGRAMIAPVAEPFDALVRAPDEGWLVDRSAAAPDPERPDFVGGGEADYALTRENTLSPNGWFAYDGATHQVSPADLRFALRTSDGNAYVKLQFLCYYNEAQDAGHVAFRWAELEPPSALVEPELEAPIDEAPIDEVPIEPLPAGALRVDASGSPVRLQLTDANPQIVSSPSTSLDWDLLVTRTAWSSNSGPSGPGVAGARWAPDGLSFEALEFAPTVGYLGDTSLPRPGPPGSGSFDGNPVLNEWYDYDPSRHTVSPKAGVFIVRGARGAYAKLQVLEYQDARYVLRTAPLTPRPELHELTVSATTSGAFVHLNLAEGRVVELEGPADSRAWDLAFARTLVRTNSGTSGSGDGGALRLEVPSLTSVTEAPVSGYTTDESMSGGMPGAPAYSGNPVLADWYDYDPTTHTLSPKPVVFVVKTVNGGYAALQITGYSGGVLQLRYVYSGPGRRELAP